MTGRELIVYILQNHLEDELVFQNGTFIGFIPIDVAAAKAGVGVATICVWIQQGLIPCVTIGTQLFIPCDFKKPSDDKL